MIRSHLWDGYPIRRKYETQTGPDTVIPVRLHPYCLHTSWINGVKGVSFHLNNANNLFDDSYTR